MTPLEAVAALWRLKQARPAEYKRLMARFDAAIMKAANEPDPIFALLAKRAETATPESQWGVKVDPSP